MSPLSFLSRQVRRHRASYFLGALSIFTTNWMAVSIPVYLQKAVDLLSSGLENLSGHQAELSHALAMIAVLALTVIAVRTLSRVFFFNPGRRIEYEVKNQLFQKLSQLNKDYYEQNQIGSIISKLQNDIMGLRILCGFGLMQVFNIITALSLTPYLMWQLSPWLTVYCVLPVIFIFGLIRLGMGLLITHTRNRQTRLQNLSSYIVSSLNGVDVLRGYSLEQWSQEQFHTKNQQLLQETLSISLVRSFMMPILGNLENILKVLVLLVGGMAVIKGEFTLGQLTAFIAYTALLTQPIMGLGWLSTFIQQGLVGIESIQSILNQPTPAEDRPRLAPKSNDVAFLGLEVKGLGYRYTPDSPWVLKDLNFQIKPNQTVGVLGKIGSGKTTLVNCLNGYLETNQPSIFLNGQDINQLHPKDLRKQVRTVSQSVFLFSQTIAENIRFGAAESSPEGPLDKVIYQSALSDEIARFPLGIETLVGEKGIMLSGGQKQRISLARAMIEPCGLLILDNVLSAVDRETERFLLQQILKRESAQSLLIISHRVEALESADLILVLDQGSLVQQGTHLELLAETGIYQETYHLQTQPQHD